MFSKRQFDAKMTKHKKDKFYSAELLDHCTAYADYVMERAGETMLVEQNLDFSQYVPEGFGTGDAVIVDGNKLTIIDLKYGKGVAVEVDDNPQLKLYALGAILAFQMIYDIEIVESHIFQPRLGGPDSAIYTTQEILDWAESIKGQAQKAWDGVEEFKSGDWCQFCALRGNCVTRMNESAVAAFSEIEDTPESLMARKPNQMSEEELAYWYPLAEPLMKFLKDLQAYALKEAEQHGRMIPGYKLVEGRSNRTYADEEMVIATLEMLDLDASMYLKPTTLVGIGELEKNIGKALFKDTIEPLLVKPVGKPTLVPESDKREPIANATTVFGDDDEE